MIVENGTGLPNADSYVSIEFADDYFSARGVSGWGALTVEQKEQSLIRATDFIDNIYQWYGKKATTEQSLRFPRVNLTDYEGMLVIGVPYCLKKAVCEAAQLPAEQNYSRLKTKPEMLFLKQLQLFRLLIQKAINPKKQHKRHSTIQSIHCYVDFLRKAHRIR